MANHGNDLGRPPKAWTRFPWILPNGLLLLAIAVFVASHLHPDPGFWMRMLQRISEASLVGGIADWFAVVALFRHPFGIPIPHTAVIPRSKDRIGLGLGQFAERHLLDPESVARKLRSADLPLTVAHWLSKSENAEALADRAAQALVYVTAAVPDAELHAFVRRVALRQLSAVDASRLAAAFIEAVRESGRHQEIYEHLIGGARQFLLDYRHQMMAQIERRSAWWVPKAVDRRVAAALVDHAAQLLNDLRAPDSGMRSEFDRLLARLITDIRQSHAYREQIEALKREMLANPELETSLDQVAGEIRRALIEDVADKRSAIKGAIASGLSGFASRLVDDEPARRRIERRLVWVMRSLIMPWRQSIGRFITDVVRSWEARTVAERLEEAVGRDLQYIRVNGTLVGGLVGGLIFLISHTVF